MCPDNAAPGNSAGARCVWGGEGEVVEQQTRALGNRYSSSSSSSSSLCIRRGCDKNSTPGNAVHQAYVLSMKLVPLLTPCRLIQTKLPPATRLRDLDIKLRFLLLFYFATCASFEKSAKLKGNQYGNMIMLYYKIINDVQNFQALTASFNEAFALILPYASTQALNKFLDELSLSIQSNRNVALPDKSIE